MLRDDQDDHELDLPAGSVLAPGAFLAVDTEPAFGLGKADSARLFEPDGVTLVDSYSWTDHAPASWGRCPDGTGGFVATSASTPGAANACSPAVLAPASPWPGGSEVHAADVNGFFGENLSSLDYVAGASPAEDDLYAVKNGPGTLYRLGESGGVYTPRPGGVTSLRYPDGSGDPDAEGLVVAPSGIFVATERDNDADDTSRPSILRYPSTTSGPSASATTEWDLAGDLPDLPPNAGLEGIAFVPDDYLTAGGVIDDSTKAAYDPARYPDHGGGLFVVGVEATGQLRGYALDLASGAVTHVLTVDSGFPAVADVRFDAERQQLWAVCDDTCQGRVAAFAPDGSGALATVARYERPAGMPDLNNEGLTVAPASRCVDGVEPAFWSDDSDDDGTALREGTIDCAAAVVAPTPTPSPTSSPMPGAGIGVGGSAPGPGAGSGAPGTGGDGDAGPLSAGGRRTRSTGYAGDRLATTGSDLGTPGTIAARATGGGLVVLVGLLAVAIGRRRRRSGVTESHVSTGSLPQSPS